MMIVASRLAGRKSISDGNAGTHANDVKHCYSVICEADRFSPTSRMKPCGPYALRLTAPAEEALRLQRPLPDEMLRFRLKAPGQTSRTKAIEPSLGQPRYQGEHPLSAAERALG
jgi:hypothetical protein